MSKPWLLGRGCKILIVHSKLISPAYIGLRAGQTGTQISILRQCRPSHIWLGLPPVYNGFRYQTVLHLIACIKLNGYCFPIDPTELFELNLCN